MIRFLCLFDTETTGVEEGAHCVEAAAALFDVESASVICSASSLIAAGSNLATRINRIDEDLLRRRAPSADVAWRRIADVASEAEIVIAHGVAFDRRFVPRDHLLMDLPWVCSLEDLVWPLANKPNDNLIALALSHGLGVASAHRAAADVDLLARLFARVAEMGHDLNAVLRQGLRPRSVYQALVPFERKDEAKGAGFFWEPGTKRWLKTLADEEAEGGALGFPVRKVGSIDRGPRPSPWLSAPKGSAGAPS